MLPQDRDLIYKHFPELVHKCDLKQIAEMLIKREQLPKDMLDNISFEEDNYHNNRCILFKLMEYENVFPDLVECLNEVGFNHLVTNLNNNLTVTGAHPLDITINVKLSTSFYDTEVYNKTSFYSTRSKNRGHVFIINNIKFSDGNDERHGAESDQSNLMDLFEKMGLTVTCHRNLSAYDMYFKTQEFAQTTDSTPPDMGIFIVMSHGMVVNNETVIVSSDNRLVPENHFKQIFNNENCALFRRKPKIFIYHICRSVLQNPVIRDTMTDANLSRTARTYSDMLICHPSVKGFSAHRNNIKGSWYIQLLCKVFMDYAHEMDIESLLRKVDEELEVVSSLPWKMEDVNQSTEQTSTFQNIAFRKCYIHPGIYEDNGRIMKFN